MSKYLVTGIKMSKGEFEGKAYDSTTLFVDLRLDESKGTQVGRSTAEFKWPNSEMFHTLKPLFEAARKANKPFYCEIEREEVSIGKGQTRMEISSIQPLPLQG